PCTHVTPCLHTQPGQATCAVQCTHITPCLQTQPGQTCAVQCTQITPCLQTQPGQATCAVGCTHITPCLHTQLGQATCAAQCTHITPCQTLGIVCTNVPACFPTEVTPCVATHAPQCTVACGVVGQPQQAQALMAQRCAAGTAAPGPIIQTLPCSLLCQTQVVFQCGTLHTPCCPIQTAHGASCFIICNSHQSLCCPVSGGIACPAPSAFCPGSVVACGPGLPGGGGPVEAMALQRGVTGWCSAACSVVGCTGNFCRTPFPCTPHCPQCLSQLSAPPRFGDLAEARRRNLLMCCSGAGGKRIVRWVNASDRRQFSAFPDGPRPGRRERGRGRQGCDHRCQPSQPQLQGRSQWRHRAVRQTDARYADGRDAHAEA